MTFEIVQIPSFMYRTSISFCSQHFSFDHGMRIRFHKAFQPINHIIYLSATVVFRMRPTIAEAGLDKMNWYALNRHRIDMMVHRMWYAL